jgi:hypothetical protein
MTGTCIARIEELRGRIGSRDGFLRGKVVVDQVYAHYQHEHLEFHHPRGGQALYLTTPLLLNHRDYLDAYAREMLDNGGQESLKRSMEDLSDGVETYAPVEFADLRRSGHPSVEQGWRIIYDRMPRQHRLSPEELRIKSRLRQLPPQLIGWIWWHVMHHQQPPPHLR